MRPKRSDRWTELGSDGSGWWKSIIIERVWHLRGAQRSAEEESPNLPTRRLLGSYDWGMTFQFGYKMKFSSSIATITTLLYSTIRLLTWELPGGWPAKFAEFVEPVESVESVKPVELERAGEFPRDSRPALW